MDYRQSDASFSLAKHVIYAHGKHTNLVFSPLSIHVCLGLTAAGSNAPTGDQILAFLKISDSSQELHALLSRIVSWVLVDGSPDGGPVLSSANGLWVDESLPLKPAYRDLVHSAYKAVSQHVDFKNKANEVVKQVNAWSEKETNGRINEILPSDSIDASTTFILANAVYFKGAWAQKFDARLTKEREFRLLNGSSVQAAFMSSKEKQYVSGFDGFIALKMPYTRGEDKGRSFSMYIYLPDAKDGLPALTERLCSEPGFIDKYRPYNQIYLDEFCIPKFKISFSFEASGVLKKLGLELPFAGGGLTEMVDSCVPQNVEKMFQSSFIEVNEEGTEAVVVTKLCGGGGYPRIVREFVADHPFLFVIREDKSNVVLFIGQLLDPLAPAA